MNASSLYPGQHLERTDSIASTSSSSSSTLALPTDLAPPTHVHPAHGLGKPFLLSDLAAAALARPRRASWAEPDYSEQDDEEEYVGGEDQEDEDDLASSSSRAPSELFSARARDACDSNVSTPNSSAPPSPFSSPPGSCAITPSSSAQGFAATVAAASGAVSLPPTPPPKPVLRSEAPVSCPPRASTSLQSVLQPSASGPVQQDDQWAPVGFSLKLLFTAQGAGSAQPASPDAPEQDDHSLPPAFFPSARIAFSPRLRITSAEGLPYSSLGGMHLGVTGMCETLDEHGAVKTKRLVADFCIDLSSGLRIWKRDAEAAKRAAGEADREGVEPRMPPGTYVLPLSMKVPNSDRLPPSIETSQFRITYTMSIALFSAAQAANGTPKRLKVFSVPFHVLPSTLPAAEPELPVLTHDHKKGMLASLFKALPFTSSPKAAETGYHIVYPSLPTNHFSPGAHSTIPVSLRILDRPLEPTDLYIRLAVVRKTYVRESAHSSLAAAIEDEWGLGPGVSVASLGYPEEAIVEPWCKEEEEVVSRWGWVPYSSRPGADPNERAEVLIQDIALPLHGVDGSWTHGYSANLDIEPQTVPAQTHGECSWFSPAFRSRPPVAKEYGKHLHVSNRFFLSIEVGFASPALRDTLEQLGHLSPDLELANHNGFTAPRAPGLSHVSGASLANPFHSPSSSRALQRHPAPAGALAFPGKLRELLIPITIGSVAEPGLNCLAGSPADREQRRRERAEREERGEEGGVGAPDEAWMCPPPQYGEACRTAPAYVI